MGSLSGLDEKDFARKTLGVGSLPDCGIVVQFPALGHSSEEAGPRGNPGPG